MQCRVDRDGEIASSVCPIKPGRRPRASRLFKSLQIQYRFLVLELGKAFDVLIIILNVNLQWREGPNREAAARGCQVGPGRRPRSKDIRKDEPQGRKLARCKRISDLLTPWF